MPQERQPQTIGEVIRSACSPGQLSACGLMSGGIGGGMARLAYELAQQGPEHSTLLAIVCGSFALTSSGVGIGLLHQGRIARRES